MNPSSEVGNASGEEMGMGETMVGVVTTVDAVTSAVEAVEAVVMAVEMREWLEVGRPETERTAAIHFFSRALVVQGYPLPLYWPGHLPNLVQLLSDSLLPHNSEAIQSGAMRSIKGLSFTTPRPRDLDNEVYGHVSDHLFRLVRETECTKIRDQATLSLGRIARWSSRLCRNHRMVLLPLFVDLVSKYAAILEPTDAEISSLSNAIKSVQTVWRNKSWSEPPMLKIFPVLIGIFQKPGKRKKAQIRASQVLASILGCREPEQYADSILESGVIGVLMEAVRVGKEPTPVLLQALKAFGNLMLHYQDDVFRQEILDMGALEAFHLVLKRPNDSFKGDTLWNKAILCLCLVLIDSNAEEKMEAVLSQEGLMEMVLDLALGMEMSKESQGYHGNTQILLWGMAASASESQMRRLMLKGPLFRLLNRYLNSQGFSHDPTLELKTIRYCLAKCLAGNQRVLRRLLDSSGLTDTIRRFSLDERPVTQELKELACDILDTYLNNPIPTPPPIKLPSIIYTRNYPY